MTDIRLPKGSQAYMTIHTTQLLIKPIAAIEPVEAIILLNILI